MGLRFRVGLGPFSYSVPLSGRRRSRSTAASRKAKQERANARARAKAHEKWKSEYYAPDAVAARERDKADLAARTRRGKITVLAFDSLKGGTFTLTDASDSTYTVTVSASQATDFLSLKRGDICEIALTRDGAGCDYFWHWYRANGAEPRNRSGEHVTPAHPLVLAPPVPAPGSYLEVVGESNYQTQIWQAMRPDPSMAAERIAVPGTVVLVPEPDNNFDKNAVKVTIDGVTVGYIKAEHAAKYRPFGPMQAAVCGHRLEDGNYSRLGIFLR